MIDPANESLFLNNTTAQGTGEQKASLGKDAFLQLLVTQLQNQDPSEPMEDKEFISQMATFSSLEQMQNMNDSMERILKIRQNNLLTENAQLIGKQVTWKSREAEDDQEHHGMVESVRLKDGNVQFEAEDGTSIGKNQLISIGMPAGEEGEA